MRILFPSVSNLHLRNRHIVSQISVGKIGSFDMCGLAGFVEKRGTLVDISRIREMTDCITYRGPDDSGAIAVSQVGLGHRRLSIVDTSTAGKQPMANASNNIHLVYNGEIYNHENLRANLPNPATYYGTSDTEVLLRLLENEGIDSLSKLNGIFAFAYYDETKGELFLARDHFGIKPLYFAFDDDRFYFASEVKSIIAGGFIPKFAPLASIDFVFTGWTANDKTLYQNVQRLPPGHYLRYNVRTGAWSITQWWKPQPNWTTAKNLGNDKNAWLKATRQALETAVERQLMSDVPVGSFCSGGVDSSLISAMAIRQKKEIILFNVDCPDSPAIDEGPWARAVADHLNAKLHTFSLTRRAFRESLVQAVYVTEYPLAFLNTVPLFLVSKLAEQEGVKVLLSGEGADECFGGYLNQIQGLALQRVIADKDPLTRTILKKCISLLNVLAPKLGFLNANNDSISLHNVFCGGMRKLTTQIEAETIYEQLIDPLEKQIAIALLMQIQGYLLPILHRTDRASMAASVEARVPFLDIDLVNLVLAMPPNLKVGVKGIRPVGKAILKEIACSYIPENLIYRPKMGFSVPSDYYSGKWPERWVSDGFVRETFGIKPCELENWILREKGQSAGWLLTFEMWGQMFIRGRTKAEVNNEFLDS